MDKGNNEQDLDTPQAIPQQTTSDPFRTAVELNKSLRTIGASLIKLPDSSLETPEMNGQVFVVKQAQFITNLNKGYFYEEANMAFRLIQIEAKKISLPSYIIVDYSNCDFSKATFPWPTKILDMSNKMTNILSRDESPCLLIVNTVGLPGVLGGAIEVIKKVPFANRVVQNITYGNGLNACYEIALKNTKRN